MGEEFGERDEYIDWDYALIEAIEIIEDFTGDDGLLRWEVEEDGVSVDSVRTFDKFQASIERKTSQKNYKAQPGERWRPEIRPSRNRDDGEFQTFAEWRAAQQDD